MPNENEVDISKFTNVAKRALKKAKYYLADLETLEIITAVGNATEFDVFSHERVDSANMQEDIIFDTQKQFRSQLKAKASKVAYTRLHLVSADLTTLFHESFMGDDFKFLREYHLEQTKKSHEMMIQNIEAVGNLIALFATHEEAEPNT